MRSAWHPDMRAFIALVLLGGCAGIGSGAGSRGGTRPGVMPMLSELPTDASRRNGVLDSAAQTAGPEQRSGLTEKEQKAETAAATAAAILGELFSHTKSATVGAATPIGGAPAVAPAPDAPAAPEVDDPGTSNADLIPWIKDK
jgi:hypothetical protein